MRTSSEMAKVPYLETISTVRGTLTSVFAEVSSWFEKPEKARAFRPPDGGWTVDEILEHITLTNHFLLLVIRKSTGKALARAAREGPVTDGESDLRLLDPIGDAGLVHLVQARPHGPDGNEAIGRGAVALAGAGPGVSRHPGAARRRRGVAPSGADVGQ